MKNHETRKAGLIVLAFCGIFSALLALCSYAAQHAYVGWHAYSMLH